MGEIYKIRSYLKERVKAELFLENSADNVRSEIYQLFKQTVDFGESNSALLIGPNEVGKSKFVDNILDELEQTKAFSTNVILVRLQGLLHINDRLALKAITLAMKLDNAVEGHVFGSFAENLSFLLDCLKGSNRKSSKSVLFILDDFDMFCAHHNQTLLYNLFDISQSDQVPICVFGITSRLDVVELFEKRVKSRFSHRQYFLFSNKNIKDRMKTIENLLIIPIDNKNIGVSKATVKKWNSDVKTLLLNNKKLPKLIQQFMDLDLGYEKLRNVFMIIFSLLCPEKTYLTFVDFEKYFIPNADENVQSIQDLTVLELCLLISMKHHCEIYDNQPMNFEMIYARYTKFIKSSPNIQNARRAVAMKAFENIQNMELISPKSLTGEKKLQKEYHMFNLEVTPQQITDAISKSVGLPTYINQWANCPMT